MTRTETIRIDAAGTGAPISPYIYGQFIEHLGRCIYGGIWAEMLEDRKFYYPIKDDFDPWGYATDEYSKAGEFAYLAASPWKVIGPDATVEMHIHAPYVGEHTPAVQLDQSADAAVRKPRGISQDGLATVAGQSYDGHVVIAGTPNAAPIFIRLVMDDGSSQLHTIDKITSDFERRDFSFANVPTNDNARLEITGSGTGSFRIGTVSLMPADNLNGWRPDVVALLRELDSPIYRWPGGNFVSGYDWRDGIGPRDIRPPRKNPAWKGVEHNDVGLHEFMELIDLIDSEAFIAVNTGLGTVEEVAEQVVYTNAFADTPMGGLRAKNGHPEPYGVTWWAVGNEMYGSWQLGHMPVQDYVRKHNQVAEAMWAIDPKLKLVGVGETGTFLHGFVVDPAWNETMLRDAGDNMSLISEHVYAQDDPDVAKHARLLAMMIDSKAESHRQYRREIDGLAEKDLRLAMDEWNHWYGDYLYGELGTRYFLKDALGIAIGLHAFFRHSDLYYMANYAQTVNVIGAIKTTRTAAALEATGLALMLYRKHFGSIPVDVEYVDDQSSSNQQLDRPDIAAAWTEDRSTLTIAMVNPTSGRQSVELHLTGALLSGKGTKHTIANDDPLAYNEPGLSPMLEIEVASVSVQVVEANSFQRVRLDSPAYGIVVYRLESTRGMQH